MCAVRTLRYSDPSVLTHALLLHSWWYEKKKKTTVGQLSLIMPERTRALSRGECDVQLWRSQSETYEVGLL